MVRSYFQLRGAFFCTPRSTLTTWTLAILLAGVIPLAAATQQKPGQHAIATAHPAATTAGREILAAGGNAFDAAVAISATLAVVEPYGSGLGGGGFWLLHRAEDRFEVMVDGREEAPAAAHRDMYLDDSGDLIHHLSLDGPLAAAIPGAPAALVHIAERYGELPLRQTLAPAIRMAREGFPVDEHYLKRAQFRLKAMQKDPETAAIFLQENRLPKLGYQIVQSDLANTLEQIAAYGRAGFYEGPVARALVDGVRAAGGVWSAADLQNYRIIERTPITGSYNGIRVTSAAPPSSGGIALMTMLNILAGYDLNSLPEATRTHLIIEAMRRAYRDRAQYLGDPDFVDIPVKRLTHPFYAAGLRASIRTDRASPSTELPGFQLNQRGHDTTHFSVLDAQGNRVSATLSINYPFGAAFVPKGTGVLLNDEMDDFSAKPGTPNGYGLVGAEANAIAAGKRPLSSMTPTFLESNDSVAILGTPGGSRIITMVLLAALEVNAGKSPQKWVNRPRFHHQFLPDIVQFEPEALSPTLQGELRQLGHTLKATSRQYGNMQAIHWDKRDNSVSAASDPRGGGETIVMTR